MEAVQQVWSGVSLSKSSEADLVQLHSTATSTWSVAGDPNDFSYVLPPAVTNEVSSRPRKKQTMPLKAADISRVRNKVVRGDLNQKRKKELKQAKLKKRIARKEAEARGETVERGEFTWPAVRDP